VNELRVEECLQVEYVLEKELAVEGWVFTLECAGVNEGSRTVLGEPGGEWIDAGVRRQRRPRWSWWPWMWKCSCRDGRVCRT